MAPSVNDIAKGKCYVTATGQVRRVIKVTSTHVEYEARGKKVKLGRWDKPVTAKVETFLRRVEHEVSWDYDPDFAPDSRCG